MYRSLDMVSMRVPTGLALPFDVRLCIWAGHLLIRVLWGEQALPCFDLFHKSFVYPFIVMASKLTFH